MSSLFEPILLLVLFTFISVLLFRDRSKKVDNLLLLILLLSCINELASKWLRHYGIPIGVLVTSYVIITNLLWLLILKQTSNNKKLISGAVTLFLLFSLVNIIFLDGLKVFNYYTFTIGAFLYLFLFIYDNFDEMKKENFDYFYSDQYLVIAAPVLFFIGFSFIFSFRSKTLDNTCIFPQLRLYDFISYLVNTVYYTMLMYYIYRSKKRSNA